MTILCPQMETDLSSRESFCNVVSECVCLGSIIIDPDLIPSVRAIVVPQHFSTKRNRVICETVYELADSHVPIDYSIVLAKVIGEKHNPAEWCEYILDLETFVFDPSFATAHAKLVLDSFIARETSLAIEEKRARFAKGGYESSEAFVEDTQSFLLKMSIDRKTNLEKTVAEVCEGVLDSIGKRASGEMDIGVSTGFDKFDWLTGGLRKTDLIIIAARPSVGKTAFALNIARNVLTSVHPKGVGIFSLEMSTDQIVERLVSTMSLVPLHRIRKGSVHGIDIDAIRENTEFLKRKSLKLDDTSTLTITKLRAKAIRWKTECDYEADSTGDESKRLSLIIVDYLQLMVGNLRTQNRNLEISEISRGLKILAKELDLPIIALSQLSRNIEQRGKTEQTPRLSDLRDSGSIEQDADIVSFLQREVTCDDGGQFSKARLVVSKNRNGATGTAPLLFHRETATFVDDKTQKQRGGEE